MIGVTDHTTQKLKNEISDDDTATAMAITIEKQRREGYFCT